MENVRHGLTFRKKKLIVRTFVYILLLLICVTTLLPLYWTVMTSLMSNEDIYAVPINFFPSLDKLCFHNFATAFHKINIFIYLKNSVIVTICNIAGTLITSSMTAYAICKLKFRGAKVLYRIFLASMMLPGMVMLVPTYLLIYKLRLMNSLGSLIIPGALSVYGIFFMRSFFLGVNDEIGESARIDGAGELRLFFQMYLPQVTVGLIILGINTFNGSWNSYLAPSLYLKTDNVKTLVVALRNVMATTGELGVTMAFSLMFSAPVLIAFICAQKYFMTGFALAGTKG